MIPNSIGTSYWEYTYDKRGNLTGSDKYTRTTEGMKWQNVANYVYDETNRMVEGRNEQGEYSLYTYNGLGVRVGRELIMKDNTHGYTDFHSQTPSVSTDIDKPEVVKESYVVDYTTATRETLTMHEEGGFDYRWVHGLDRLSVKITSEGTNWWGQNVKQDILKDYTHQDRMGSTTNMTDKFGRIVGRADYNEWGEITYKEALSITSAYRRIWPEANYTGHDWDDVLGMYYAKARFYDPAAKRFVSMDPVKGNVTDPLSLVSYLYCVDNPLKYVDPLGEVTMTAGSHSTTVMTFSGKTLNQFNNSGNNSNGIMNTNQTASDTAQYILMSDAVTAFNSIKNRGYISFNNDSKVLSYLYGSKRNPQKNSSRIDGVAIDLSGILPHGPLQTLPYSNNPIYFVNLSCLENLFNSWKTDVKFSGYSDDQFNPADYTRNMGKNDANLRIQNIAESTKYPSGEQGYPKSISSSFYSSGLLIDRIKTTIRSYNSAYSGYHGDHITFQDLLFGAIDACVSYIYIM